MREYAARSAADLTVHFDDITLDAVSDSSQLEAARAMCEPWPTPFRVLPGNHDVGDNPPGPEFLRHSHWSEDCSSASAGDSVPTTQCPLLRTI
jgi:3',5'-cyclic AMP phosphodiesterase CpdA